jgi:hypothetical protein
MLPNHRRCADLRRGFPQLPIAVGGWLDRMDQDAPDFSSEASSSATGTITGPGHR